MRARFLAALLAALLSPAAAARAGDPIMPLGDVQAGMQCTGLSVVRGTAVSSFDVEVVDVIDAAATGSGAADHGPGVRAGRRRDRDRARLLRLARSTAPARAGRG